jgi:hypothetical protein
VSPSATTTWFGLHSHNKIDPSILWPTESVEGAAPSTRDKKMLPIRGGGQSPEDGLPTPEDVLQMMLGDDHVAQQMPTRKVETKTLELEAAAKCYDNLAQVTTLIFGFASFTFLNSFKADPSDTTERIANHLYIVSLILTITSALLCFGLAMLQSFYYRYFITQIVDCQEKSKNWCEIVDHFRKVKWMDYFIIFLAASALILSFTTLAIYPYTTNLDKNDAQIPAGICFAVGGICYVILASCDGRRYYSAFNSRGNLVVNIYL